MDMGIPLEVTAEGMKGTDDSRSKGFLVIKGVHPVGNYLSRSLEQDIKKGTVLSEKFAEFLWDSKDNVSVAAVDELGSDRVRPVSLVGSATGIAEAGFAAEGHIVEMIAVMAVVKTIAFFAIAAAKHFFNFILDNLTNARIGREKRDPVILKNLLDGKLCTHNTSPSKF